MGEAEDLAAARRAVVEAAAGCGKTHLIASAVAVGEGRQLVLTHTHAGVDALRRRLRTLNVSGGKFHVDTIAGWALKYAAAYPETSGVITSQPTQDQWNGVYGSAVRLLKRSAIKEVVRASYAGIYVDEYQDCSAQQHALVTALADILPCRVLGDPLQGIFNFRATPSVQWHEDVEETFPEHLQGPTTPHRWAKKNPNLGAWLQDARKRLETGERIDLTSGPVRHIPLAVGQERQQRIAACLGLAQRDGESVVAIHAFGPMCHDLAKCLKRMYSCVEPIECDDLLDGAAEVGKATGLEKAVAVINFAAKCMTQVAPELKTIREGFAAGRAPDVKKHRDHRDRLLAVSGSQRGGPVLAALDGFLGLPDVVVFRRELLSEMRRALKEFDNGGHDTLRDAAWQVRSRTRVIGRPLPLRAVGTTLLVKGLEFDHAIILDADALDHKNLYVAMTRGAKSLTVFSRQPVLTPPRGR